MLSCSRAETQSGQQLHGYSLLLDLDPCILSEGAADVIRSGILGLSLNKWTDLSLPQMRSRHDMISAI